MFRCIPKIGNITESALLVTATSTVCGGQPVRWKGRHRKPAWKPRAPSKMFIVTTRKKLPPEEYGEVLRLYQNYKSKTRLVRHFWEEHVQQMQVGGAVAAQMEKMDEEEHKECMEYNDQENQRIAALREERFEKEYEELLLNAERLKLEHEQKLENEKIVGLEKIEELEEMVKTFVQRDKIEGAILDAMANQKDYNFSIDLEGRVYEGKNTLPHLVDQNTLQKLPKVDEGVTNEF